jgi:hypothetical protein
MLDSMLHVVAPAVRHGRTEDEQATTQTQDDEQPVDDVVDPLRTTPDNAIEHDVQLGQHRTG